MGREEREATDTPRTDGLLRRIDYVRQTQSVPKNGLNAPPGNNPYAEDFGILPYNETIRLLKKLPRGSKKLEFQNVITIADVHKYVTPKHPEIFRAFMKGNENAIGRRVRRRLSVLLRRIEAGQMVKLYGEMMTYEESGAKGSPPEKKPEMVYRVSLETGPGGKLRPTIVRSEPLQPPKQMPRLFMDFRLPGVK
jgi:hypothetical protein